jgi:choline-sulfatase
MRASHMDRIALVLSLSAALVGCEGEHTHRALTLTSQAEAEAPRDLRGERVIYAIATHPEHVEVRRGRVEEWPLGGIDSGKLGLGGFGSDVAAGVLDARSVLVVKKRAARLRLPIDEAGPIELALLVRGFARGKFGLKLDGEALELEESQRSDGWTMLKARSSGRVAAGEHELLVTTPPSAVVKGIGSAGAALAWLRVGPPGSLGEEEALSVGEHLFAKEGRAGFVLRPGVTLRVPFIVPKGGKLRAEVSGAGKLRARVLREGKKRDGLVDERVQGALVRPLSRFEGQLVYLELEAAEAEVSLLDPRLVVPAARPRAIEPPKNVLIFLIDTLRADRLAPINPKTRVKTPGLERFVASATTFLAGHSQENWTKPSVATLFSGLMPWEHTATGGSSVVPNSVPLLSEVLKREGFTTASFIANGYVSDRFGFGRGWDSYRNYIRESRRTRSEFVAADVLSWLDSRNKEKPFFLYVHTIDPHVPYRPPEEFIAMYGDPGYRGNVNFRTNALFLEHVKTGKIKLNARDKAHLEALYDGEISYHDVHFNAILEGLRARGLDGDTLVIVTADHGEEFWDHGSVGHGHNVYEELLHVPFFVRHPGIARPGARFTEPVGLVDIVPTVLDSLGKPVPESASGRSILPLLAGETTSEPRFTVSGFMDNWRTIVVDDRKLIVRPRNRQYLHMLASDPNEERDVSAENPLTTRYLLSLLGVELARTEPGNRRVTSTARRPHRASRAKIDDDLAAQLRALGYVH